MGARTEAASRTGSAKERVDWTALGAAGLTLVLWASAFVGIRAADDDVSPAALAFGRLLVGSVVLGTIVAVRRERLPARRDLPPIVLCGLLWFGAYNVLLNAGERRVDAGNAAMLVGVGPILIAPPRRLPARRGVSAHALRRGRDRVRRSRGHRLREIGRRGRPRDRNGAVRRGRLRLRGRRRRAEGRPAAGLGADDDVPLLPGRSGRVVAGGADARAPLGDASGSSIAWVAYLGAVPTAIAFTTWAYALARTSAGQLSATTYLVPALSILLGWALLGEAPPAFAFLGGAGCLAGVAVSRRLVARQ